MEYVGAVLLLLFQAFTLALVSGGIGSQLGTMFKRATAALNLPQLHEVAVAAESWLLVAALIVWAASVVIMIAQAIKRGSVSVRLSNDIGAFVPVLMFLGIGVAVTLIGGAGLLVAAVVHVFVREEIADVAGLVAIAGLVGWLVGVTRSSPTVARKA